MTYVINPDVVIDKFGGVKELAAKYLNYFGIEIKIKTINKWKERKSLPSKRYIELMELANYYKITIPPIEQQK